MAAKQNPEYDPIKRAHEVALHMMAYNLLRIYDSLRCTPAMAAGVSKRLWEIVDIVTVIEDWAAGMAA